MLDGPSIGAVAGFLTSPIAARTGPRDAVLGSGMS